MHQSGMTECPGYSKCATDDCGPYCEHYPTNPESGGYNKRSAITTNYSIATHYTITFANPPKNVFSLDNVHKTKLPDETWHVHSYLYISNFNLKTLKDLNVSIVDGYFICDNNQLTSLEGAPKEVRGGFSCSYNQLTDLIGAPKVVNGDFYCSYNQLTSLDGAPNIVTESFSCRYNAKQFTENDVKKICNVKRDIYT